jgi:hypothetical protein
MSPLITSLQASNAAGEYRHLVLWRLIFPELRSPPDADSQAS